MQRGTIIGALALLLAAACSGGDDEGAAETPADDPTTTVPARPCAEIYAEGRPTADVLAETQCLEGDVLKAVVIGSFACPDGRTLNWNDDGWGYTDGAWAHHARPDGQLVPPQADYDACS